VRTSYLIFGIAVVAIGVMTFLSRKYYGRYAHRMLSRRPGRSPTPGYWAALSVASAALFWLVGAICIAAAFVN
jgi:hypothetical protein